MIPYSPRGGWLRLLVAPHGSFVRGVPLRVLVFGAIALAAWVIDRRVQRIHIPLGFHEIMGAVIALILAFRTNTAYARFWEGRTLWGAIVNASRNLARIVQRHASQEADEAKAFNAWIVAFAHVTRRWLRSQREWPEVGALLPPEAFAALTSAEHPPLYAAHELSRRLAALVQARAIDPLMAHHAEGELMALVNCLGGCERIWKTPTPLGYVLLSQRLIALALASLPFAILGRLGGLTPLVTMMVAYPILMIEGLGSELDDPFGHDANDLPLSRICATIEADLRDPAHTSHDHRLPSPAGEKGRYWED